MSDRNKPTDPEWVNRRDPSSLPKYSIAQGGPATGSGKGEGVGYDPGSNAPGMLGAESKGRTGTTSTGTTTTTTIGSTAASVSNVMDQRYEMQGQMQGPSAALGTVGAETNREGGKLDDPSKMVPSDNTGTAADIGNKGVTRQNMAERRGEEMNKGYGQNTEVREKAGTEGGVKGAYGEGEERYGRSGPDNFPPSGTGKGGRSGGGGGGMGKNWAA
jgi:hypothetical protein